MSETCETFSHADKRPCELCGTRDEHLSPSRCAARGYEFRELLFIYLLYFFFLRAYFTPATCRAMTQHAGVGRMVAKYLILVDVRNLPEFEFTEAYTVLDFL